MAVLVQSIGKLSRKWPEEGSTGRICTSSQEDFMLNWAVAFFVIALIAAIFGFFGIASAAVGIAKILFFVFLVLFLVSLVGGLMRRA
jgi:uncharacterized membrane protein YtjA (UPF0391 family)